MAETTDFRGPSPDVGKETQFKPGESGNPGGKRKRRLIRECLTEILEAHDDARQKLLEGAGRTGAMELAVKVYKHAQAGSMRACEFVIEHTQGKAIQAMEIGGKEGQPISLEGIDARLIEIFQRAKEAAGGTGRDEASGNTV